MAFRSSTGNLAYYDDEPRRGGPERWDRSRFERFGREAVDRAPSRFDDGDRDRYVGGRAKLEVDIRDRVERARPTYFDEDRFERPARRRPEFLDEPIPAEVANRALAPYRRKSIVEREAEISVRRPARPQYIRRQSSLDTFDRKPLPRYGDREYDEWRPPANVPIPLPIRQRELRARRPSSPVRYREEQFEEIRYRDVDSDHESDYRDVQIHRSRSRRRASKGRRRAKSSRSSSSSSSFEDVSPPNNGLKRGKTRMPKRLVKKQAVIELGYPYEEEVCGFLCGVS